MERIPFMSLDINKIKALHSSYSITAQNVLFHRFVSFLYFLIMQARVSEEF